MKKFALLLAILLVAVPSFAQNFTTVTGTALDPQGIPLAGGTISAVLVPSISGNYTLNGQPISGQIANTALDSTGSINGSGGISVPSNAVILPASSQWVFTVCGPQRIPGPIGSGGLCFTTPGITISGASQNISTNLASAATSLAIQWNPSRIFSLTPAASNANIPTTTMVATVPAIPAAGTRYTFSAYVTQTVLGASCAGNSTVVLNAIYQDPNAASPQTQAIATFTVTTNGTLGIVPLTANAYAGQFPFVAKAGSVIQYSTTFTAGGSCAPAPIVQVFPILELQ